MGRTCALVVAAGVAAFLLLDGLLADAQPGRTERPPRKVAFLVGPEKYLHDFGKLDYTARDVTALAEVLRDVGFDEVVVLTDPPEGKNPATRDNILDRLDKLLNRQSDRSLNVRQGDVVLVALSGHGLELDVPDAANAGRTKRETFFAPADGKKGKADTLVGLTHLVDDVLAPCGGRNLLLVDACREVYDPNKGKGFDGRHLSLTGQTAILFSCSSTERSWESAEVKHGVFTQAVLEVMAEGIKEGKSLSWAGLVAGVEGKMTSDEYRKLLPESQTQTPVVRAAEVPATVLITRRKVDPPKVVKGEALRAPFSAAQAKAAQEAWARALGKKVVEEVEIADGAKMEFVLIAPGTYKRGTSEKDLERLLTLVKDSKRESFADEMPQREVTITRPFYLGKYAVTQAQYQAVTGKNPSWFCADGGGKGAVKGLDTAQFPVEEVSWEDAVAFCEAVREKTGRKLCLPREAEWEYACRAGTETFFHFGDRLNGDSANCVGDYPFGTGEKGTCLRRTCKVGSYAPNAFGLYDMHGNVYQWCEDCYGSYEVLKDHDPIRYIKDKEYSRVQRGGSWLSFPRSCRAALRDGSWPGYRNKTFGFRLCFRPLDPRFFRAPVTPTATRPSGSGSASAWTDLHHSLWPCYSLPSSGEVRGPRSPAGRG
jgi:formylglycine-generating enzyme required for sulfatase activity